MQHFNQNYVVRAANSVITLYIEQK
jgi:hypothetical protein